MWSHFCTVTSICLSFLLKHEQQHSLIPIYLHEQRSSPLGTLKARGADAGSQWKRKEMLGVSGDQHLPPGMMGFGEELNCSWKPDLGFLLLLRERTGVGWWLEVGSGYQIFTPFWAPMMWTDLGLVSLEDWPPQYYFPGSSFELAHWSHYHPLS